MASPSELSLEFKPQSYSMLLKSFGDNFHNDLTMQKLEDFLSRLEEERLKIDAFKRELPLCMQLLTNAVEVYKQQLQACRANGGNNHGARPVLEEFIPLRSSDNNNHEKADNKAGWMTNAQLWNQTAADETKPHVAISAKGDTDITLGVAASPKLGLDAKPRNGGAFLPFSKERSLPELALSNSADNVETEDVQRVSDSGGKPVIQQNKGQNGHLNDSQATIETNNANLNGASSTSGGAAQTNRKARRCWSPDLHRRFVQALQMLGGSQVATPKQIRELMKVDGLTNDEVKSHLQKYRLHTRRPSPSPQATGGPAPQLVVLGGIWVPPEYATAAHGGGPAIYHHHSTAAAAHHPPPPHFCSASVPQEFYTSSAALPPLPPPIHHHHHHQIHAYKATSSASPDSPTGRDSTPEEGRSESGGERKGLAALKEEGEESNGSEITLKF
ncbi:PREDICTED: myb family transcription factor EFM [Tarenaya hassleriana]|uniref:myb family transcription factor EFM n=1 Tax=Tarenaya hassleriana TaxID=28532 RepID=UPI00053C5879|nr:PREDICTED: myb family transcription factor EFM [Tarenaya hassleriana]